MIRINLYGHCSAPRMQQTQGRSYSTTADKIYEAMSRNQAKLDRTRKL